MDEQHDGGNGVDLCVDAYAPSAVPSIGNSSPNAVTRAMTWAEKLSMTENNGEGGEHHAA